MAYRTHVGRGMDLSLMSNRLALAMTGLAFVVAVAARAAGSGAEVLWAPAHTFLVWALSREIDPDRDWTALIAAFAAGVWVLLGLDVVGAPALAAIMLAARVAANTTGRRPLISDLIGLGAFAAAVSFTPTGWVAGFGLAVGLYIDDRMSGEPTRAGALAAAGAALGASGAAALGRVFPQAAPGARPFFMVAVGALALLSVVRPPPPPIALVDSGALVARSRLHAARALVGVLVFAAALVSGRGALAVGPVALTLALSLAAAERS